MRAHLVASGKYHDIDFARLELLKLLAEDARIRTTVSTDYADLAALAGAELLITYTCDVVPDPSQTAALEAFLRRGGRWFALHGTNSLLRFGADGICDTPDEAPAFMDLVGTQFAAHPPIAPFKVEITRPDHPLTTGLRGFRIEDELYLTRRRGDIDVLLHTVFTGSCPEFRDAEWDEPEVPVLYERRIGEGAILYLTLGHCRGHYDLQPVAPFWPHPQRCGWNYPVFYELLRRGIRWGFTASGSDA
ncbi:ThuA domain-containing protein [Novosphingobium flavum]|uniref:ThuA domain-containing protein n=1 Tax=Novosphingobium aerophilum TaxID=2839843 RepID=A0A7X1KAJ5_9SPHN|nr:ThuA domain-containing protein [Novosphingobium aerophilum]MBC2650092.1 ThuA domain-containing protein [Novosphingobium aerophilum]MBC2661869.1 ThuA domain-containing protein [Novosphingobium aerophilum]